MIYGILRWIVISLILIILVHHLFYFFKNTLTIPKIKDLVDSPSNQYKEIENTLNSTSISNKEPDMTKINHADVPTPLNPNEMKNELKNFFKELNTNQSINIQEGSFAKY